jgi:uncharacterized protein (DUF3084 family)
MTLLQAVDGLNHRIEALDAGALETDAEQKDKTSNTEPREISTGNEVIDNLARKLANIESTDASLQKSLDMLVVDVTNMTSRIRKMLVCPDDFRAG